MSQNRPASFLGNLRNPWLLRLFVLWALGPSAALANPTGGTIVAGSGTMTSNGNTLNVNTATNQTIINWNSFSIAGGETTNINQPNSGSTTLNRVTGGNPSAIYGTLNSNGSVLLLNPNGVLVGQGGQVNTQSFTASTLDLSDTAFLAGGDREYRGDSPGKVVNLGKITASGGDIFLISRQVVNEGALTAAHGTVGLGAGRDITVAQAGSANQRLSVALGGAAIGGTGVDNQGTIQALKAELKANGNIYSLAVNNGGLVQATGSANVAGQVWLTGFGGKVKNTGTLRAKNADGQGGTIETSGQSVEIAGTIQTGQGGSWLIDPDSLTIDAAAAATIEGQLAHGDVVEQTTAGTTGDPGDITVTSAITWGTASTLTLDAYGSIVIDASISHTSNDAGGLILSYGGNGGGTSGYTLGKGAAINLTAGSTLRIGASGSLNTYTVVSSLDALIAAINRSLVGINTQGNYALGSNVTAPTAYTTDPLPSSFYGIFDGLGHTITGLTITEGTLANVGLFASNYGTIRNIGLIGDSVTATVNAPNAGGLVGQNYAGGVIENSYATGGEVSGTGGNGGAGGLVGYNNGGTIEDSYAGGTVTGGGGASVGGLAGSNTGLIGNSYATATVQMADGSAGGGLGGLTGFNDGGTIEYSYATGTVSGPAASAVGGLAGVNNGTIRYSYATGDVSGVGGTGGPTTSGTVTSVGGLVGSNYGNLGSANPGLVEYSYATGAASVIPGGGAGIFIGGLFGDAGGTLIDDYWDKTTTPIGVGVNGPLPGTTGLTTDQMFTKSNSGTGFDDAFFNGTGWQMVDGSTVPYLPWQSAVGGTYSGTLGAVTVSDATLGGTLAPGSSLTGATHYVQIFNSPLGTGDVIVVASSGERAAAVGTVASGETGVGALNLVPSTLTLGGNAVSNASLATAASLLADFYTASGNNITVASDIDLSASCDYTLDGNLTVRGDAVFGNGLTGAGALSVGGTATFSGGIDDPTGAMTFGQFVLTDGTWTQNAAGGVLPGFSADDFTLAGGTFLRVKGGDGTSLSPYQIADVYGLEGIGSPSGVLLGDDFILANDIDASGTAHWNGGAGFIPIAADAVFSGTNFSGTFDGAGHVVSGVMIDDAFDFYAGLFARNTGTIRNVGVTGTIHGGGGTWVGLLVGNNDGGTIENSYAMGNAGGDGSGYVGGLVGGNLGTIGNSYAAVTVDGEAFSNAGGLAGVNEGAIDNSYATGAVSGGSTSGGLVGLNFAGTIDYSYATGAVSDGTALGGLVGNLFSGAVTGSYWNITTSGTANGSGTPAPGADITGLTSAQMLHASSYAPAFLSGWNLMEGISGPYLSWQSVVGGTVSGNPGAITVTVNGVALAPAASGAGDGSYYFLYNSALDSSDAVTVRTANFGAFDGAALAGSSGARIDLAPVANGSAPGTAAGSGVTLPNGQTVTIPTAVFSPTPSIFPAAYAGGASPSQVLADVAVIDVPAGPVGNSFAFSTVPSGTVGEGVLASTSGVTYIAP